MRNFRELRIWEKGIEIARECYQLTKLLPNTEKYGLSIQITSSASSIPANIAEGSAKSSSRDFKRFLEIALGSSYELETHLIIATELISETETINGLIQKTQDEQKMIVSMINKI